MNQRTIIEKYKISSSVPDTATLVLSTKGSKVNQTLTMHKFHTPLVHLESRKMCSAVSISIPHHLHIEPTSTNLLIKLNFGWNNTMQHSPIDHNFFQCVTPPEIETTKESHSDTSKYPVFIVQIPFLVNHHNRSSHLQKRPYGIVLIFGIILIWLLFCSMLMSNLCHAILLYCLFNCLLFLSYDLVLKISSAVWSQFQR